MNTPYMNALSPVAAPHEAAARARALNLEVPRTLAARASTQAALRFLTAGSVDDGKSTLIGRLLYDSRAILADQYEALQQRAVGQAVDLSLLTDGLEAEREQGITIDVAYRYFATPARKFIIADAPGHEQYTRNMVTAAAGSDAAVVLVDVTKINWRAAGADIGTGTGTGTGTGAGTGAGSGSGSGSGEHDSEQLVPLLPQTRRHALLAHLLRVPSIVFAINKMDAVDDPAAAFDRTRAALLAFAKQAGFTPAAVLPVSALRGDNVVTRLDVAWYQGPSLLELLESLPAGAAALPGTALLPVQFVSRVAGAATGSSTRVLWGRLAQGALRVGDHLQVHPSGEQAVVQELRRAGRQVPSATAGDSAGVVLDRELDVSRGDWLGTPGSLQATQDFSATLAWLDTDAAVVGRKYLLRHGHRWVPARIAAIHHRLDVHDLQAVPAASLAVNQIGHVQIELQESLPLLPYSHNSIGGALIVVDPSSHRTSGALLVRSTGSVPLMEKAA